MKPTLKLFGIFISLFVITNKIQFLSTLDFGEQLKKTKLFSYDKLFFIIRNINDSLVFRSQTTHSLLGCSLFCSNLESVSFYFIENTEQNCKCNNGQDKNVIISDSDTGVRYGCPENGIKVLQNRSLTLHQPRPERQDCLEVYQNGFVPDGVYVLRSTAFSWCDMRNGGWTVIQRRQDGSENFYRPWNDYLNGFGNRTGEYWIGLENVYQLTLNSSQLRIEMETFGDVLPLCAYAEYTLFKLASASNAYRLTIGGFSGDCGDSIGSYHNGSRFTTYDRDNDAHPTNCAQSFHGAWWYASCHYSNLNGAYKNNAFGTGMNWFSCWGHYYSVKSSLMKVKRIVN